MITAIQGQITGSRIYFGDTNQRRVLDLPDVRLIWTAEANF